MQGYYNGLLEKYSVKTLHSTHRLLVSFFTYCVKADLIIKNPLVAVELPKKTVNNEEYHILSQKDIDKMIEATNTDIENFIFLFAIFTGLRQGELLALTHKDIDFEANVIRVNKSVKHFDD